jgi:hypothetical protein
VERSEAVVDSDGRTKKARMRERDLYYCHGNWTRTKGATAALVHWASLYSVVPKQARAMEEVELGLGLPAMGDARVPKE